MSSNQLAFDYAAVSAPAAPGQPAARWRDPEEEAFGPRRRRRRRLTGMARLASREAWERSRPRAAERRLRALEALHEAGPRGATNEELATRLRVPVHILSSRTSELKRMGLARETGERRRTASGATAAVLVAAP